MAAETISGRAQVAQEEPDHQRRRAACPRQVLFQRRDDLPDQLAVVVRDADLHARRATAARSRSSIRRLTSFDDRHGIRAADLDDADADRRFAVKARQLAEVRQAVLDARRRRSGGSARPRGSVTIIRRAPRGCGTPGPSLSRSSPVPPTRKPPGSCRCSRRNAALDVLHRDAEGRHALEVELDADRALALAADATSPTPSIVSRRFLTTFWAYWFSCCSVRSPLSVSHITGVPPISTLATTGGSASSGSCGRIWLTLACTSLKATSMSLSSWNVTRTIETAGRRYRFDVVDAGDAVDDLLDRVGDARVDDLGVGAGQVRDHGDHREIRPAGLRSTPMRSKLMMPNSTSTPDSMYASTCRRTESSGRFTARSPPCAPARRH